MSRQAALEFATRAAQESALRERIRSKGDSYSDERLANFVSVGSSEGFDFTAGELRDILSQEPGSEQGELREEDLEAVVGGANWYGKAWAWLTSLVNGGGDSEGSSVGVGVRG